MSLIRKMLFEKHRNEVYNHESLKHLSEKYPIYERYLGGWLEKDFQAIKVRKELRPEHYTYKSIQLPEAFKFSDVFTSIRLTDKDELQGEYFLGTRCDVKFKNNWQNDKFIKAYVKPCQELIDIQKRISGYDFSSFELIQRDDEFLITCNDKTSIGPMNGLWIAVIYDLPEELLMMNEE